MGVEYIVRIVATKKGRRGARGISPKSKDLWASDLHFICSLFLGSLNLIGIIGRKGRAVNKRVIYVKKVSANL